MTSGHHQNANEGIFKPANLRDSCTSIEYPLTFYTLKFNKEIVKEIQVF